MRSEIIVLLGLMLLFAGCISNFDSNYAKLESIYKKYNLKGAFAPLEVSTISRYEEDLHSLKTELSRINSDDAKALVLLIDAKINLAEMQKNLSYSNQQLRVYSEFTSCGVQFREAQDAIKNALKNAESALNKIKLLKSTFPKFMKKIEEKEGDLENIISNQVKNLNNIDQQLKEICG